MAIDAGTLLYKVQIDKRQLRKDIQGLRLELQRDKLIDQQIMKVSKGFNTLGKTILKAVTMPALAAMGAGLARYFKSANPEAAKLRQHFYALMISFDALLYRIGATIAKKIDLVKWVDKLKKVIDGLSEEKLMKVFNAAKILTIIGLLSRLIGLIGTSFVGIMNIGEAAKKFRLNTMRRDLAGGVGSAFGGAAGGGIGVAYGLRKIFGTLRGEGIEKAGKEIMPSLLQIAEDLKPTKTVGFGFGTKEVPNAEPGSLVRATIKELGKMEEAIKAQQRLSLVVRYLSASAIAATIALVGLAEAADVKDSQGNTVYSGWKAMWDVLKIPVLLVAGGFAFLGDCIKIAVGAIALLTNSIVSFIRYLWDLIFNRKNAKENLNERMKANEIAANMMGVGKNGPYDPFKAYHDALEQLRNPTPTNTTTPNSPDIYGMISNKEKNKPQFTSFVDAVKLAQDYQNKGKDTKSIADMIKQWNASGIPIKAPAGWTPEGKPIWNK